MKLFVLVVALAALAGVEASAAAQEADEQPSHHSLQALENQNAQLRKEIAALREQLRLQKEYSASKKKVDSNKAPIPSADQPRGQAPLRTMSSAVASPDPAANAYAAGRPVKAMGGVEDQAGRIYVWLDGSYQRLNLPNYGLGARQFVGVGSGTTINSFDAHATGAGLTGGVGYLLPHAPLPPWFGSDLRAELIGSSVQASASQTAGATLVNPAGGFAGPSLLSGISGFGSCFIVGEICRTTTALHTDYSSWQAGGRIKSDYRFGALTLTPSAGLFGGNVRNMQTLAQTSTRSIGAVPTTTYNATTVLRWTDLGERVGLDGKLAIHPWITLELEGWVGRADRWTSFTGNDVSADPGITMITSSIAQRATKTAYLANLEGSVNVSPSPAWHARAFVGLNYDDSVPGFSAPIPVAPAAIVYAHETSYYAGGGATYRFH